MVVNALLIAGVLVTLIGAFLLLRKRYLLHYLIVLTGVCLSGTGVAHAWYGHTYHRAYPPYLFHKPKVEEVREAYEILTRPDILRDLQSDLGIKDFWKRHAELRCRGDSPYITCEVRNLTYDQVSGSREWYDRMSIVSGYVSYAGALNYSDNFFTADRRRAAEWLIRILQSEPAPPRLMQRARALLDTLDRTR